MHFLYLDIQEIITFVFRQLKRNNNADILNSSPHIFLVAIITFKILQLYMVLIHKRIVSSTINWILLSFSIFIDQRNDTFRFKRLVDLYMLMCADIYQEWLFHDILLM